MHKKKNKKGKKDVFEEDIFLMEWIKEKSLRKKRWEAKNKKKGGKK